MRTAFAVATVVLLAVAFCAGAAGAAIIYSCDFEQGNTGFASGYTYQAASLMAPELYDVDSNPRSDHSSWASYGAFQGTLMMIVNGGQNPATLLWAPMAPIPVLTISDYTISVRVASSYSASPAVLSWSVNGAPVGGTFTASTATGARDLFQVSWNSGSSTSATLNLFNLNDAYSGNDFTLDAIAVEGSPVPLPGTLALMGSGLLGLILTGARRRKRR